MTEGRLEIFSINFDPESVIVAYMHVPTDVRVDGKVQLQRQARIDLGHPDYADDADMLQRLAQRLLANALEDFEASEPWVPPEADEEPDDERGMGE